MHGKRLFWEARFEPARTALESVLQRSDLKDTYRYEAHLFLAFTLVRSNEPESVYQPHFESAIRLNFRNQLDTAKYPPDLIADYKRIHHALVGCLYIYSDPETEFMIIDDDSVLNRASTPIEICELVDNHFDLLFSKDGYIKQLHPLHLTPGKTDTLQITLKKF